MPATVTVVRSLQTNSVFEVDEKASLSDMKHACSMFFKKKHGKRETYTVYRGCLIVRNTVTFTGAKPTRRTVVYLFTKLEGEDDLFCIDGKNTLKSIDHAKRLIDTVLGTGTYNFNMEIG